MTVSIVTEATIIKIIKPCSVLYFFSEKRTRNCQQYNSVVSVYSLLTSYVVKYESIAMAISKFETTLHV